MFEHGLSSEEDEKEDKGDYNQGDNVKAACLGIILPVVISIYVNYFDLYCRISFKMFFFFLLLFLPGTLNPILFVSSSFVVMTTRTRFACVT